MLDELPMKTDGNPWRPLVRSGNNASLLSPAFITDSPVFTPPESQISLIIFDIFTGITGVCREMDKAIGRAFTVSQVINSLFFDWTEVIFAGMLGVTLFLFRINFFH